MWDCSVLRSAFWAKFSTHTASLRLVVFFGAVIICSGLVAGAILPPIIAKYSRSLMALKILTNIIGLCYLAFIGILGSNYALAAIFISALLGAAPFSLIPITLEYLVDIMHPIAPESTSSLC
jgi:MFS transporter, FLVCR family, MFS-domain-containing protein 7